MRSKRAVLRVEASRGSGGGHAVRCMALAARLSDLGWHCTFAIEREALETTPALGNGMFELFFLPKSDQVIDELAEANILSSQWPEGVGVAIVDSYRHSSRFEGLLRGWTDCVVAIDGTKRQHDVDILVDPNLDRTNEDHLSLVPPDCCLLLGPQFAMLRDEFAASRAESLARRRNVKRVERILVAFGASDPSNMTPAVIKGLEDTGTMARIDAILGLNTPDRDETLRALNSSSLDIKVHGWSDKMAALMSNADLFVSAAGSSTWEACVLGLPNVIVCVADNQKIIAEPVSKVGAAVYLGPAVGLEKTKIANVVGALIDDPSRREIMAKASSKLCDGIGAQRVANAIEEAANT